MVNDATGHVSTPKPEERNHRQSLAMMGDAIREAQEVVQSGAMKGMVSSRPASHCEARAADIGSLKARMPSKGRAPFSARRAKPSRNQSFDSEMQDGQGAGAGDLRLAAREMLMARRGSVEARSLAANLDVLTQKYKEATQSPKASARIRSSTRLTAAAMLTGR